MDKTIDGIRIGDGDTNLIRRVRESIQMQDDISNFADEMFTDQEGFLQSGDGCFDLEYENFIYNEDWRPMIPDLVAIAEDALDRGFIPIPLVWKRPYLPNWQKTERKDALRRIIREEKKKKANNVGVLTGEVSDLIVVDYDYKPEGFEYPDTLVVETSKGYHLYFKYDPRFSENRAKIGGQKIDLKSNGGQIVYPGSVHEDGTTYTIINDPGELMEIPDDIASFLT